MPNFMNVDSARLDKVAAGEKTSAPQRPDDDVMHLFHDCMESTGLDRNGQPEEMSGDDSGDSSEKNDPGDAPPIQMPSLPLDALFSGRMATVIPGEVRPQASISPGELAEKLVERVLVGQTEEGGQEVRLRLGSDVLPDTEIRLTKGADGMLLVVLVTNNASSFQTLVAAQGDLQIRLERLDSPVRIDITSENGEEDNDSRRRSRGWIPETDEPR